VAALRSAPLLTHSPAEIRALLDRHGLDPRRALGQNFVADPNTVRRIARLADVGPGDSVLEIGAGLGSLTLALAELGPRVVAVETDRDLLPVLRSVVASSTHPSPIEVVEADARTARWDDVLAGDDSWTLVANLPYNISTSLVLDLLAEAPRITRMLVMVQREVGERLAAGPGSAAYGIPSVLVACRAKATVVGRVPASVFVPVPRVESVLVRIDRHTVAPVDVDLDALARVVRTAFGQRRKMLRKSLQGMVAADAFAAAGIEATDRPESLGLDDWARLTAAIGDGAGPLP